uniref:Putative DNA polymerase n=1 Tax=viral metagenome TaxID=1070528 RepID=A0A6M3KWJ3_9ZZZZ
MTLDTKYRPQDFSEFYGNKHTIEKLKTMLEHRESFPHALLFTGPSGCGKTTLARIVATHLGCGNHFEINAANDRGIDTAREVIEMMSASPLSGESRVTIIDEAHMTQKTFQNAILKILEEPPKTSYFALCTTEPQGLINTIKTRCSLFQVDSLMDKEVMELLKEVADLELGEGRIDDGVLKDIASYSEGCAREALSRLEQVIHLPPKAMKEAVSKSSLEVEKQTIDLCRGIIKREGWSAIATILEGVTADPEGVRRAVLGYFRKVLLGTKGGGGKADHAAFVIECFKDNLYSSGQVGLALQCYNAVTLWGKGGRNESI